jgi:hypothetical protein
MRTRIAPKLAQSQQRLKREQGEAELWLFILLEGYAAVLKGSLQSAEIIEVLDSANIHLRAAAEKQAQAQKVYLESFKRRK